MFSEQYIRLSGQQTTAMLTRIVWAKLERQSQKKVDAHQSEYWFYTTPNRPGY